LFIKALQIHITRKSHSLQNVFAQNDAHEFLLCLLDTLHTVLQKPVQIQISGSIKCPYDEQIKDGMKSFCSFYEKEYSPITEYTVGQYQSILHNTKTNTISYQYEPFMCVVLEIPNMKNINIYDCLNHFNEREKITPTLYKSIHFWKLPQYFIVVLKRFTNTQRKNNVNVDIPFTLNLQNYTTGPEKYSSTYKLICVGNHRGTMRSGHYYAFCLQKQKNKWHMFNDSIVTEISPKNISSPTAYCLFYEKLDSTI